MMHSCTNISKIMASACLVAAGFYTPACAATLLVPEQYPNVAVAINAAADGDTISLGSGNHSFHASTTISARTLTFEGRADARIRFNPDNPDVFTITDHSNITFQNVAMRGHFYVTGNSTLSMLNVTRHDAGSYNREGTLTADGATSVILVNCDVDSLDLTDVAFVRIQGSAVTGYQGRGASPTQNLGWPFGIFQGGPGHSGQDALSVTACPNVQLIHSSFLAGDGGGGISLSRSHFWGTFNAGPGGNGIVARDGSHITGRCSTAIPGLNGTPVYGDTPADGVPVVRDETSSVDGVGPFPKPRNVTAVEVESLEANTER